ALLNGAEMPAAHLGAGEGYGLAVALAGVLGRVEVMRVAGESGGCHQSQASSENEMFHGAFSCVRPVLRQQTSSLATCGNQAFEMIIFFWLFAEHVYFLSPKAMTCASWVATKILPSATAGSLKCTQSLMVLPLDQSCLPLSAS